MINFRCGAARKKLTKKKFLTIKPLSTYIGHIQ